MPEKAFLHEPAELERTLSPMDRRGHGALLDDYASIALERGPRAVSYTALRQRSHQMRDILSYHAVEPAMTWSQLRMELLTNNSLRFNRRWAAQLAYTVGLQSLREDDYGLAVKIFDQIADEMSGRPRYNEHFKVYVEMLMALGRNGDAQDIMQTNSVLAELEDNYLWLDSINPYVENYSADNAMWHHLFQERFEQYGLEAPSVRLQTDSRAFDGLTCVDLPKRGGGPLLTVVITTFKPDQTLLHSLRSITRQTWQNLEIILVDDGSGPEFDEILDHATKLDSRVRLIRQSGNKGTYAARNAALRVAMGEFITGQDSDDWSHPRRLERQAEFLYSNAEVPGVVSRAYTMSEDLINYRVGLRASKANVSSLMFRRSLLATVGGYAESRKGVDSEFMERIKLVSGVGISELSEPLAVIRTAESSLSRGDFGPRWRHPARRSLVSSYRRWHKTTDISSLKLDTDMTPFFLPRTFRSSKPVSSTYDVVFAGEWRQYGGPQRSMIEEIKALLATGKRVAIIQMSAARFMSIKAGQHCNAIQDMLNRGLVDELMLDDAVTVRLLVVRYPPVLQFMPEENMRLKIERLIILANQTPSERDGRDVRYYVNDCAVNAEVFFGLRALWVPQGPTVREAIVDTLVPEELANFDMPGILDVAEWRTDRSAFRSERPVIGRHSRDNVMKWPDARETIEHVYPIDGTFEVRFMGGHRSPLAAMGRNRIPSTWLSFPRDFLDVRTFLNSIDFFVYFQHEEAYDAFGRATLEALATGCVAILPERFRATFGNAALYAEPDEVRRIVTTLYEDPAAYRRQSELGLAFVDREFGPVKYRSVVESLLLKHSLLGIGR